MRTHCRQWACGHCDCLGIFLVYRLTTFDVRIRRKKSSKSTNRVFYISLNKGYFGKAIFSRLFSARYHIIKKKKKKKKRYWAYVDVVLIITLSILATCLVSSQCFALITFEVLNQTPQNLLGSCRSSSRWYLPNCIKNGWELTSELTSKWIYILKYSSKFHTNLINNFWSTRSNSTEITGQWP